MEVSYAGKVNTYSIYFRFISIYVNIFCLALLFFDDSRFEFWSFPNIENICFVSRRMSESQTVNNAAGRNRMNCLRHSRVQHQLFYIYIHSIEISAHMSNECTFYNAYVDDTQLKSANALHSNL